MRQYSCKTLVLFWDMSFHSLELVHTGCSSLSSERISEICDLRNDLYPLEGVEGEETLLLRENCAVEIAFFSLLEVTHNLNVGDGST